MLLPIISGIVAFIFLLIAAFNIDDLEGVLGLGISGLIFSITLFINLMFLKVY